MFIVQEDLDRWVDEGKIEFTDGVMTLLEAGRPIKLVSAVRFLSMVAGEDELSLLGQVVPVDKLGEMEAEHYRDSVIVGDNAYQVEEGYVGEAHVEAIQEAPMPPAAPPQTPPPAPVPPATNAADALPVMPIQVPAPGDPVAPSPPTAAPATPSPTESASEPLFPTTPIPSTTAPSSPSTSASTEDAEADDTTRSDADLLSSFLLDNLK